MISWAWSPRPPGSPRCGPTGWRTKSAGRSRRRTPERSGPSRCTACIAPHAVRSAGRRRTAAWAPWGGASRVGRWMRSRAAAMRGPPATAQTWRAAGNDDWRLAGDPWRRSPGRWWPAARRSDPGPVDPGARRRAWSPVKDLLEARNPLGPQPRPGPRLPDARQPATGPLPAPTHRQRLRHRGGSRQRRQAGTGGRRPAASVPRCRRPTLGPTTRPALPARAAPGSSRRSGRTPGPAGRPATAMQPPRGVASEGSRASSQRSPPPFPQPPWMTAPRAGRLADRAQRRAWPWRRHVEPGRR